MVAPRVRSHCDKSGARKLEDESARSKPSSSESLNCGTRWSPTRCWLLRPRAARARQDRTADERGLEWARREYWRSEPGRLVVRPREQALFRFLLLRWAWKKFLWTLLLWRVSRLPLHLAPAHTDLAGGLGFLADGQRAFSPIVFAGGLVLAGQVVNDIVYQGATLRSVPSIFVAYALLAVVFLVAPLLSSPRTSQSQEDGVPRLRRPGDKARPVIRCEVDSWPPLTRRHDPGEPRCLVQGGSRSLLRCGAADADRADRQSDKPRRAEQQRHRFLHIAERDRLFE